MKRSLALLICFAYFTLFGQAQPNDDPKLNALSIQLGKTGLIYNLDYDHKFRKNNFGFHIGGGSNLAKYLNALQLGGGAYYLVGKSRHFLELGIDIYYLDVNEVSDDQVGFAFVYPDYTVKTFYPSTNIGYRSYSQRGLFRLGLSPGIVKGEFVPGGYISYGILF